MRPMRRDEHGMSPVLATVVLTAMVIVLSASTFAWLMTYHDSVTEPAPAIAITSREGGIGLDSFHMKMISSSAAQPLDNFLLIVRTPENGTLVAAPPGGDMPETQEFYFQLGAGAGTGVHNDNGTEVGEDGLGGFHLRVSDIDDDGRLGGGDQITIWYDGDGDQGHQDGRDDRFPSGPYEFELKHRPTESYVALETRDF